MKYYIKIQREPGATTIFLQNCRLRKHESHLHPNPSWWKSHCIWKRTRWQWKWTVYHSEREPKPKQLSREDSTGWKLLAHSSWEQTPVSPQSSPARRIMMMYFHTLPSVATAAHAHSIQTLANLHGNSHKNFTNNMHNVANNIFKCWKIPNNDGQETSAIAEKPMWRHVASRSMHCLRDIRHRTVGWPRNCGLGSLKVNRKCHLR